MCNKGKTTLVSSGEDVKTTLVSSGEDAGGNFIWNYRSGIFPWEFDGDFVWLTDNFTRANEWYFHIFSTRFECSFKSSPLVSSVFQG